MNTRNQNISSKAATWVENHTRASLLLIILCLTFALNLFLFGPGSDGGSGLGGTGKYGGESGLGGTGKSPDTGPSFKLGANDQERDVSPDDLQVVIPSTTNPTLMAGIFDVPVAPETPYTGFDVSQLRLNKDSMLSGHGQQQSRIDELVAGVQLDSSPFNVSSTSLELTLEIPADSMLNAEDVIASLMLAETSLDVSPVLQIASEESPAQRNRVTIPVRPERPDRFNVPTRISPVSRASIPAPPPVRPMRTLSSLLNR